METQEQITQEEGIQNSELEVEGAPETEAAPEEQAPAAYGPFKTADELLRGYQELRPHADRVVGDLSRLRQQIRDVGGWIDERGNVQWPQPQEGAQEADLGPDDEFLTVGQAKPLLERLTRAEQEAKAAREGLGRSNLEFFRQLKRADPNFEVVGPRFDQMAAQLPPAAVANPRALEMLWNQATGDSMQELLAKAEEKGRQEALRTRRTLTKMGVTGAGAPERAATPGLTERQRRAARGMGISEEDYAESAKAVRAEGWEEE